MSEQLPRAIGLALTTALISGTSIFLNKIAVATVSPPLLFTFLKNGLVALILFATLFFITRFGELKKITKGDWLRLLVIGVIGGSLPFMLFFTGLSMTSAVSANLIHKTLFVWVTLLAVFFLKERVGYVQGLALILLAFGTSLLSEGERMHVGQGEVFIFLATLLWAVENIIAKKVLTRYSSILVASARMIFGSLILLVVVGAQGKFAIVGGLSLKQWLWVIIPSFLLFGYVTIWYTALKYAPATLVASLLVPAPFVTYLLTAVFLTHSFPLKYLFVGVLFAAGVALLIAKARFILPHKVHGVTNSFQ